MSATNFSLANKTKSTLPSVPFAKIKDFALGKSYDLSLSFIGNSTSQKLNRDFRGKNKPTNILSFELGKKSGEIFIAPNVVKKQTKTFNRSYKNLLAFLFIHGLMHLKGMEHGSKMEKAEEKIRVKFGI